MPNGLEPCLAFHFLDELLLCLVGGHSRNTFQGFTVFFLHSSAGHLFGCELFFPFCQIQVSLLNLTLPLIYQTDSLLKGLVPLHGTSFCSGNLSHLGLLLLLDLGFRLQYKVFRLQLRFFNNVIRLVLGVLHSLACLFPFFRLLGSTQRATDQLKDPNPKQPSNESCHYIDNHRVQNWLTPLQSRNEKHLASQSRLETRLLIDGPE